MQIEYLVTDYRGWW